MGTPTHTVSLNPYPGTGELVVLFSGYAQTPARHKVGPQLLDYHLVHYVISGKGTFRCRGRDYEITEGGHFFIFPSELSSYESDEQEPWQYLWIGFKGSRADELLAELQITPHQPTVSTTGNRKITVLFHKIARVLKEGQPFCDLQAGAYFRLVLAEYGKQLKVLPSRSSSADPGQLQVEQAVRWLNLQYPQPISIEQMAHTLGYHRSYLSKIFKQHTGMSPMQFLLKIRMERARILLREPLTIEQVASSVGFPDALYFSKQFKKWFGSSPTRYREEQAESVYDCQY
ncbi:AraC family transcriptional regulator [Paenibacillus sp. J2TS4]|uniref:AraC family transcriptional regulator n=1 Tax=Paenibacillus sp. J2TS4 TaxID=2807194 RepID=UPI001B2D6763|nr:AraC family transcriptional regulator [Paenibacillus sp. J2TS4]GIP32187.1 AraC family transcriptional regulator [Paenibacillus sp. J2TS4]